MLLVTGASGFVGRHFLAQYSAHSPALRAQGGEVLPLFYTDPVSSGVSVDLVNPDAVNALFTSQKISTVVHLAAEARLSECDKNPEKAYSSNVMATGNLLTACQRSLPYFLYVSTDMVFKGDRGEYTEEDTPDATSVYGRTKISAEALVRNYGGPWCIVRPALIYGRATGGRTSSLSWTLDTIRSGNGHFFSDEIRTPVWVDDLVALIIALCNVQHQGVVHAGGPERLSRLDFANHAADVWELSRDKIWSAELGADPANQARPRDLSLVSHSAHDLHPFTSLVSSLQAIRDSGQL